MDLKKWASGDHSESTERRALNGFKPAHALAAENPQTP